MLCTANCSGLCAHQAKRVTLFRAAQPLQRPLSCVPTRCPALSFLGPAWSLRPSSDEFPNCLLAFGRSRLVRRTRRGTAERSVPPAPWQKENTAMPVRNLPFAYKCRLLFTPVRSLVSCTPSSWRHLPVVIRLLCCLAGGCAARAADAARAGAAGARGHDPRDATAACRVPGCSVPYGAT